MGIILRSVKSRQADMCDRWTWTPGLLQIPILVVIWLALCMRRAFIPFSSRNVFRDWWHRFGDESSGGLVDWCVVYILLLL